MLDNIKDIKLPELYELLCDSQDEKELHSTREKMIKTEISRRYQEKIADTLKQKDEPFGVTNFCDDGLKLAFTTPKKVKWDQEKLQSLHNQIVSGGENPADYMKIEYDVPEAKYKNWPQVIKNEFIAARTVEPGSITVKIEPLEEQDAA